MKYGIVCAMPEEIKLIEQDMRAVSSRTVAGRKFSEGSLYGQDVVLVMSHIGKVAAAMTAALLIETFGVDCVLLCGTAGGIAQGLHVGDFVVGDRTVQHDLDAADRGRFYVPLLNVAYFPSDAAMSDALYRSVEEYIASGLTEDVPEAYLREFGITEPKVVRGTVSSSDEFIRSAARKKWLLENVEDIRCVEMEGAAMAQVCYEFGVPFSVIRVISDGADNTSSVDFDAFACRVACYFTRGVVRACLSRQKA